METSVIKCHSFTTAAPGGKRRAALGRNEATT
jgi:hypothetical protein